MNTTMDRPDVRRTVHVVVHTHWDREWYLPRETTLARLEAVMRQVLHALDEGELPGFLFDGQTVALRDLMTFAPPALCRRLEAHARAGRLALGPWYVAADEFLASGESLLRNLEFGHADAAAFGAAQKVGYLPDTFGHAGQMPLMLAQFDIRDAVVWRGAESWFDRFVWVADDRRSAVRTQLLSEGYYQIPLHGADDATALAALETLLDRLAPRTPAPEPLLLLHGGDHLAPAPALAARVAAFNRASTRYRLELTTLAAHAAQLAELHTRTDATIELLNGELRDNSRAFVLPDVLSTRRHLKLAHQVLEDRLLGEIEPLQAALQDGVAPPPALEAAWRTLIEQQAHDSICGCSIDAVHDEMAARFVALGQRLDALRHGLLAEAGFITLHRHADRGDVFADDSRSTLFNPLPHARSGPWRLSAFLRGDTAPAALQVHDPLGTELPCTLLAAEPAAELVSPLDDFPERISGHRVEFVLAADLPALGLVPIVIAPRTQPAPADGRAHAAGSAPEFAPPPAPGPAAGIANAAWHVFLDPLGRLVLEDRRSGRTIERAIVLQSESDAGDSYTWSPAPRPWQERSGTWRVDRVRHGAQASALHLSLLMSLPAGLDTDRQGPAPERLTHRATLELQLHGDEPVLHARLRWHNRARDHRLRLLLPWRSDHGSRSWSDTAFAWTERRAVPGALQRAPLQREMPVAVMPSTSAVAGGGWAVAHRALHEHEVLADSAEGDIDAPPGPRQLALTLLRCVGWMSRRDLLTRRAGAGPDIETPGAQCPGEHVFEFTLRALAAGEPTHLALQDAARLRRPPLLLRGHGPRRDSVPPDTGNPAVEVSAVRRLADGRLELRLWNPTPEPQPLALSVVRWQAVWADGRPSEQDLRTLPPLAMLTLRERQP